MNKENLLLLLETMANKIEDNKQFLTVLDAEIGDADHGINMARGFSAVKEKLPSYADLSTGSILSDVGKTLIKVIAGSSGPLYGSAFKVAGKIIGDSEEISYEQFVSSLEKGIEKIQFLGQAVENEKTMLDAMLPSLRALKERDNARDGLAFAVEEAEKGVEHTKEIVATKGRASYVGERSLGHQDPGATSYLILLTAIKETIE